MTAAELCHRAAELGLRLELRGDKLAVAPADRLPPDLAAELREHKAELLVWLNHPPCPGWQTVPPADLPLNPVMPRPTSANRERVIAFLLRQGADRPSPLTAWLVRREDAYFDSHGRKWDCGLLAYAAARDATTWQLKCSEGQLWRRLQEMELNSNIMENP